MVGLPRASSEPSRANEDRAVILTGSGPAGTFVPDIFGGIRGLIDPDLATAQTVEDSCGFSK